ncbi:DUF6787 family protein [Christiangramia forsetii]|uniref:DUF6787 domain-containing protein n=2 Tax=Christiangramia forsetii TaxID=411153 RepID=A0M1E4_CHRFK|nr:DUF6787 family protein [Christiangramia forsetii]GGG42730.1 hypothetical protein GCM10011532_28240 [Christiangramia forsetii]CAL66439.1 conserved hypothetical protein, membrane [Christiangramia forsetii KT0803]
MKKLKDRWGIDSNWQLFIIFLVFAITGSSAAKLASPVCELVGITQQNSHWSIYWTFRILLIFPIYQVLLVSFGWIFGQFEFFWAFEKKMLSRLGLAKIFKF